MENSRNRQIAKNTLFLYLRMILLMVINLYTVKVTLRTLGVEDYGIYNVVASVVASLGFLTSTLTSATQRFLSFHLGTKNFHEYSKTFSLLFLGFILISIVLFIISELIGIFIIDDWLNIPHDRIEAAKWIYQTSIITFIFQLIVIPYTSSIVSHEKMSVLAYITILDGLLKLLIVYLLVISKYDRLTYYGILIMVESIIVFSIYAIYCHLKFAHCKFLYEWDKNLFKQLISYTSWSLFGSVSGMLITQGQNILLNIFFGPIINTAKAIADRVSSAVNQISANFYLAVSPQIVKSYASGETEKMISLGITSSRLSFFLLQCLSYPLIICIKSILNIWLGTENVTETMLQFTQLALIFSMVNCLEQPITQMIRATGNIKKYQFNVGIITLTYIPIAAIFLYNGASAISSMIILIILYIFVQIVRIYIAHNQIGMSLKRYYSQVINPIIIVSSISILIFLGLKAFNFYNSTEYFIIRITFSFTIEALIIWIFGMKKNDRNFVKKIIVSKFKLISNG